ncbi:MAG: SRPBCC family protein [Verrucomicrobiota bacterium]
MLIQKTFHMHMGRGMARTKLADLTGYRRHLIDVTAANTIDGVAHFEFRLPGGFRGEVDVAKIEGDNPSQTLFRSNRGNLEVVGVLEYFEIKPNLTEVVLTLEYRIGPPIFRWLDYFMNGTDRFLNRQLEQVEAYFSVANKSSGIRADRNLASPINGHQL